MSSQPERCWVDFGWWPMPDANGRTIRKLLSWNAGTGELAFQSLVRWDPTIVVAVIKDEDEIRRLLDGWGDHHDAGDGLSWLTQRFEGHR